MNSTTAKILIVEDDVPLARSYTQLLSRMNCAVEAVYDGQAAQLSFDFRISRMSNGVEEDRKVEISWDKNRIDRMCGNCITLTLDELSGSTAL